MFKLMLATLAGLYAVLYVFGEPDRRPDVARDALDPEAQGLTLAAFSDVPEETATQIVANLAVSDAEAVRLALAAGQAARAERKLVPLHGTGRLPRRMTFRAIFRARSGTFRATA